MAREGFEPSKALGRQIYSLLRLTASLPRPNSRESAPKARFAALHETNDLSGFCRFANFSRCVYLPNCRSAGLVELAKGFEPPTG